MTVKAISTRIRVLDLRSFVLADSLKTDFGTETCRSFLWLVFYSILWSAFVGQYTEYKKMHGMSNIKL